MNRFSPKKTLSNFATAVRETVDSVNKKNFATMGLIVSFTVISGSDVLGQTSNSATYRAPASSASAAAATSVGGQFSRPQTAAEMVDAIKQLNEQKKIYCTTGTPTYDEDTCDQIKNMMGNTSERKEEKKQLTCDRYSAEIEKIGAEAKASCGKAGFGGNFNRCVNESRKCEQAEIDLSERDEEDEGGAAPYCNKMLQNKCPSLSAFNLGNDYKQDRKDAERDRKDAKKEVDDLMKEQREQQQRLAKQQREINEQQENDAADARKSERKLAEQMKEALQGLEDKQKQAFESAQAAYTKMEIDYIEMRKQARDSEDMVAQAKDDLQVMCRGAAEKKYQEAEKVRLAQLAARKKNLGAGTNVSGAAKRTKAATARARQIDFTAYFNECTSGSSADGVGGNNRIKTAERAKASADKLLADKAQLIEKQRAQMLEKLKAMEGEATNQKSKIVEEINTKLTQMNDDRTRISRQNAARISEFQREQNAEMQSTSQLLQTANGELMKTQQEAYLAESRYACAGRSASRSESRREKIDEGFANGLKEVIGTAERCSAMQFRGCGLPSICKDAMEAKAQKMPGKHDVSPTGK